MPEISSAESLIQEELAINAQIKSLDALSNDLFSRINLKESSEWTAAQLQDLDQRQMNLNNLYTSLEEGLENHFAREDVFLRLYLGSYILEAITKEVTAIKENLSRVKALFNSTDLKGINREDSLVRSLNIRQAIDNLSQQITSHNQKVDSVLTLLKSVVGTETKH